MRRVLTVVLALLVTATMTAAGQQQRNSQPRPSKDQSRDAQRGGPPPDTPRFKWWQNDRIKAELKLTSDQSARIEEIFQAHFTRMKDVVDELMRREAQLSNLITGNDATEAELLKQSDQVESLRSSLSKARTLMLFRMRRVLSPEQRTKLADIQKAQDKERRMPRQPDHLEER
jgi:periplasmic protein CpxP/Spy